VTRVDCAINEQTKMHSAVLRWRPVGSRMTVSAPKARAHLCKAGQQPLLVTCSVQSLLLDHFTYRQASAQQAWQLGAN
jgi:hypothetical protein